MTSFVLAVMARAPVPGQCKTRLARTIGGERAARVYDAMLRDTLEAVASIDARRVILAAPWVLAGPADDGGYGSIAMSVFVPDVFEGISWSTPRVLEETRARCASAHVRFAELPRAYDVDDDADLARATTELRDHPERAPRTARALAELARLIGAIRSGWTRKTEYETCRAVFSVWDRLHGTRSVHTTQPRIRL